jgi:hypothetical protein
MKTISKTSLEALKKKAVSRVPSLSPKIAACFGVLGITWGQKTCPSVTDITSTLTSLINDLDPVTKLWLKSETGRLFAEYVVNDDVANINFGLVYDESVMKVL